MHFNSLLLAALAAFFDGAFSAPPKAYEKGKTMCFTTLTDQSAPYQTKSSSYYPPCTSTHTSTTVVTSTLPSPTTTVTQTSTITATTSTLTDTSIVTSTSTSTSTATETSTTSTTSTIPFPPVQSTLPDSAYSGYSGSAKRDLLDVDIGGLSGQGTGGNLISKKRYPKEVCCYKWKNYHCVNTATTVTQTTTVSPTGSVTSTVTDTTTTYPSATTTITTTSTAVASTSTTTTTVSTTTILLAATADCSADNFADNVGGVPIDNASQTDGNDSNVVQSSASTALACCQAGLVLADAEIFLYTQGDCIITTDSTKTCPAQSFDTWYAIIQSGQTPATVGNLMCGSFTSSGAA